MRRLAECYRARYETFCLRALGIPIADRQARSLREPARAVLQRLSDETGIPVEQLEQMTFARSWDRLMDELRRLAATPEGRAALERFLGQRMSHNS